MPTKRKPKRGGERRGAGRPVADASGAKRPLTVWLSPAERAVCEQLGAGSAAAGVRRLIAQRQD